MDILVKMDRFQIKQNVLNVKSTLNESIHIQKLNRKSLSEVMTGAMWLINRRSDSCCQMTILLSRRSDTNFSCDDYD